MGGLLLLVPVQLALVAGAVVVVVLLATAARSDRLLRGTAAARRHGASAGALAVVAGLVAAVATAAADPLRALGSGVSVMAAPVAFALAHTAVVLGGEATWPRPRGGLRSAVLAHRSRGGAAPVWLLATWRGSAVLVLALCAAGWATADPSGRAFSVQGDGWGTSSGPYPGAVFAVPALVATGALVVAVELGLRLVAARPAVPADPAGERALRRASAHRLLRGASAGLLALAGGTAAVMGASLRSAGTGLLGGVVGHERLLGHDPVLVAVGTAVAATGAVCALAALVVLLVPAPRPREPRPAATGPARATGATGATA